MGIIYFKQRDLLAKQSNNVRVISITEFLNNMTIWWNGDVAGLHICIFEYLFQYLFGFYIVAATHLF